MKKQHHNLDEIFRDALGGHREVPPPAAWTDIERRLDEQGRRKAAAYLRWPWILGLLLFVGAGTWLAADGKFNESDDSAAQPLAASTVPSSQPSASPAPAASVATDAANRNGVAVTSRTVAGAQPVRPAAAPRPAVSHPPAASIAAPPFVSSPLLFPAATSQNAALPQPAAATPRAAVEPMSSIGAPLLTALPVPGFRPAAADTYEELLFSNPLRFTLGADAGYEYALRGNAPGRYTASLSLSWEFRPGLSVGVQPTYRFGQVQARQLQAATTSRTNQNFGSYTSTTYDSGTGVVTHYVHTSQSYDSVVTTATTSGGGRFYEVSLPVLLSYQSRQGWSVGLGPTLNFGGAIRAGSGGASSIYHVAREDSILVIKSILQTPVYSSNNFNSAAIPAERPAAAPGADPQAFRLGYLLNVGYRWRQLMLNASLSQQLTGYNGVDRSFRGIFSSPYLRLTLGYRLPFNLNRPFRW